MPVSESIYVAFFLLIIVFMALFCLYLCVRLFSAIFIKLDKNRNPRA